MSTSIRLFYPDLQKLTGNRERINVEGSNVGECLNDLVKRYPESHALLFDKQGRLLKQVYVYVNAEGLNKADFAQKLLPKDELILAVLITGG